MDQENVLRKISSAYCTCFCFSYMYFEPKTVLNIEKSRRQKLFGLCENSTCFTSNECFQAPWSRYRWRWEKYKQQSCSNESRWRKKLIHSCYECCPSTPGLQCILCLWKLLSTRCRNGQSQLTLWIYWFNWQSSLSYHLRFSWTIS